MLAVLAVQCAALVMAVLIVLKRPDDPVALLGAWALATTAVYTIVAPARIAAIVRSLPAALQVCVLIPFVTSQLAPAVLFTFFSSFPRKLIHSTRAWALAWAPMVLVTIQPIGLAWLTVQNPTNATTIRPPGDPIVAATAVYVVAGLCALVLNYRRLADPNERRRVTIVVVGAVAGLLPGLLAIGSYHLGSDGFVTSSIFLSRTMFLGTLCLLVFPASFTYAILRHRVFDIPVIIRQSIRYAVARGLLLSLIPLLAVLLAMDVAIHENQSLSAALERRAWAYTAVAGIAIAAHIRRRHWLESLDRHFFRERYNTHRLLRHVVDDMGACADWMVVAPRVVARIEAALHPEFAALLERGCSDLSYRSIVATPAGLAPPPLRVDSTLAALLRVLRKPIEVPPDDVAWLAQQLPKAELEPLREARIELIVPMVTTPARGESLLMLGIKRSEETYSQEDIDLLAIIAAHLALLRERPTRGGAQPQVMLEECPQCGRCYDDTVRQCEQDGAPLVSRPLPRVFATRYRLDYRLGDGGFGTVYEAFDGALDRRVAIKTIRGERLTHADVAGRFHREARLAAGFTHPNVVTIHDFGVDASGGAFIVMELLAGTTLRDELQRHSRLSTSRTLAIMRDICLAIDAAHRRHLVHRDLKPENIFLIADGSHETAKVLDFGVATR